MTDSGRTIIIGGGHNGLACAAYLARAGRKVTVLEAAEQLGGLASTREFEPGFHASCAHLLYLLDESIASDLALSSHGLSMARTALQTISLDQQGRHITLSNDGVDGDGITEDDQSAYIEYRRFMSKFAAVIGSLHKQAPPRITPHRKDLLALGKLGFGVRRMGRNDMREFLRIAAINIHDVLEENFFSTRLKGALALDAVLGSFSAPRSNNTVFNALHRLSGNTPGAAGAFSIPVGGMGAVTDALAAAARSHGAEIRTACRVAKIQSDGLQVLGVTLDNGETIHADTVVSNADPRTTLLGLLGAGHLEAEFARRFNNFRSKGYAAKLHLALDAVPDFKGLVPAQAGERLLIAPGLDAIDLAFNPCKYGEFSNSPVMEITIPTLHDPSLAPDGKHVLSAIVQYAPYELKMGWENGKPAFLDAVMDTLSAYAPGIRKTTLAAELLTPADLERTFGVSGGHWHHGELSLDQALMLRPAPRAAQYRMPLDGLFLCGAGCHPGGGVMGSAGRNAARAVLAEKAGG